MLAIAVSLWVFSRTFFQVSFSLWEDKMPRYLSVPQCPQPGCKRQVVTFYENRAVTSWESVKGVGVQVSELTM